MNFGDQLTPEVLSFFNLKSFHCPIYRFSRAVGVGSILDMVPTDYRGYILGSGLISGKSRTFPNAKPLLVRGHLTRQILGLNKTNLVGDPGLIADSLFPEVVSQNKEWDIGLVPHYVDKSDRLLHELLNKPTNLKVKVIDVKDSPENVVSSIYQCRNVLSSSLHGLVVADSFGIPNLWIKVSDKIIGGDFKFRDYYSCFKVQRSVRLIRENDSFDDLVKEVKLISPSCVDDIKSNIYEAYSTFQEIILKNKTSQD